MSKDLISVIVPVYNVEKYLERCMNSILKQTYTKLEIILVDDGATDNSGRMCDEYARLDSRVRVIHKENGGLSDARNAGLSIATGEYIGYVDSDDWIETDMYERMYKACVENDAQLAVCRYASEYEGSTSMSKAEGTDKVTVFTKDELLKIYIAGNKDYIIYNSVWSKLFKRELIDGVVFPKGRNSEDIMYTTKAFCKVKKAVYIDSSFYHYVLDRAGSIMNVARGERMFRDEIPFWREHISHIRDNASSEMADLAAYHFWRRLLFYYVDMKNGRSENAEVFAKRLVSEIKNDKAEIDRIYNEDSYKLFKVAKGDKARMKLFMICPSLYAFTVRMYERFVIPIRAK